VYPNTNRIFYAIAVLAWASGRTTGKKMLAQPWIPHLHRRSEAAPSLTPPHLCQNLTQNKACPIHRKFTSQTVPIHWLRIRVNLEGLKFYWRVRQNY
jgi:hypothetical protein